MNISHLVIGYGEIGKAIYGVLKSGTKKVEKIDINNQDSIEGKRFSFLHICFPYSERFTDDVVQYVGRFGGIAIVHSTVPVGTCKKLGVVHSPVIGIHPNLIEGVLTFIKYFSGPQAKEASEEFKDCGINVSIRDLQDDTEAAKLWSTTRYGLQIIENKEIKRWCDLHGVDFDFVYKDWAKNYNQGYKKMGKDFHKPILKHMPGNIGGHCVTPNCDYLDSWIAYKIKEKSEELVVEENKKLEEEKEDG